MQFKNSKTSIFFDEDDYANFFNLTSGVYKDNKTFFNKKKYLKYISGNKNIQDSLPILLFVKKNFIFEKGKISKLIFKGKKIGTIKNEQLFKVNKRELIKKTFGFFNLDHPIIRKIMLKNPFCLSGKLKTTNFKTKNFLKDFNKKYKSKLSNSIAFSSRNIPHLGHEFIISNLIKMKFKNIFIIYINSDLNNCSFGLFKKCYNLISKKLKKKLIVIKLNLPSFKAGPREAYFQAQIVKQFKIKNFSIGRDHAGILSLYRKYDSQKFLLENEIKGFRYIFNHEPVICKKCKDIFFNNNKKRLFKNHDCKKNLDFFSGKKNSLLIKKRDFKKLKLYLNNDIIRILKTI